VRLKRMTEVKTKTLNKWDNPIHIPGRLSNQKEIIATKREDGTLYHTQMVYRRYNESEFMKLLAK